VAAWSDVEMAPARRPHQSSRVHNITLHVCMCSRRTARRDGDVQGACFLAVTRALQLLHSRHRKDVLLLYRWDIRCCCARSTNAGERILSDNSFFFVVVRKTDVLFGFNDIFIGFTTTSVHSHCIVRNGYLGVMASYCGSENWQNILYVYVHKKLHTIIRNTNAFCIHRPRCIV